MVNSSFCRLIGSMVSSSFGDAFYIPLRNYRPIPLRKDLVDTKGVKMVSLERKVTKSVCESESESEKTPLKPLTSKLSTYEILGPVRNYVSLKDQDVIRYRFIGKQYHNIRDVSLHQTQPQPPPFGLILPGDPTPISTNTQPVTNLPPSYQILDSGMVLLKNYISLRDQAEIVRICHNLGVGPGGFQQPGYSTGHKLQLHRMCFGRNWDPETKYRERYNRDGSIPPRVPPELVPLIESSIQDARSHLNSPDELPLMSPDTALVNFYTATGRLGLHQDRDESPYSIRRGLPVVSFSIGDTSEFLFGRSRDEDKLQNVLLESGDVLIFGGRSRLIYHGVRTIFPNSAPLALLQKIKLRPGRLNLTFRQF